MGRNNFFMLFGLYLFLIIFPFTWSGEAVSFVLRNRKSKEAKCKITIIDRVKPKPIRFIHLRHQQEELSRLWVCDNDQKDKVDAIFSSPVSIQFSAEKCKDNDRRLSFCKMSPPESWPDLELSDDYGQDGSLLILYQCYLFILVIFLIFILSRFWCFQACFEVMLRKKRWSELSTDFGKKSRCEYPGYSRSRKKDVSPRTCNRPVANNAKNNNKNSFLSIFMKIDDDNGQEPDKFEKVATEEIAASCDGPDPAISILSLYSYTKNSLTSLTSADSHSDFSILSSANTNTDSPSSRTNFHAASLASVFSFSNKDKSEVASLMSSFSSPSKVFGLDSQELTNCFCSSSTKIHNESLRLLSESDALFENSKENFTVSDVDSTRKLQVGSLHSLRNPGQLSIYDDTDLLDLRGTVDYSAFVSEQGSSTAQGFTHENKAQDPSKGGDVLHLDGIQKGVDYTHGLTDSPNTTEETCRTSLFETPIMVNYGNGLELFFIQTPTEEASSSSVYAHEMNSRHRRKDDEQASASLQTVQNEEQCSDGDLSEESEISFPTASYSSVSASSDTGSSGYAEGSSSSWGNAVA